MEIQYIVGDGFSDLVGDYHLTPLVKVGNTIHISGATARSSAQGPEGQFVAAFEGVADLLATGGAGWDDVVKMTTYHVGGLRTHVEVLLEVKDRYVKVPYPAWTAVGVSELANPKALLEIDVIAQVSE